MSPRATSRLGSGQAQTRSFCPAPKRAGSGPRRPSSSVGPLGNSWPDQNKSLAAKWIGKSIPVKKVLASASLGGHFRCMWNPTRDACPSPISRTTEFHHGGRGVHGGDALCGDRLRRTREKTAEAVLRRPAKDPTALREALRTELRLQGIAGRELEGCECSQPAEILQYSSA
jgi:hypothetical protein